MLSKSKEILNLSRLMLQAAEASEWDIVQAHEKQRQTILDNIDESGKFAGEAAGNMARDLEEAAELNKRIVDLGLNVRADLAKVRGTLQRGRKAAQAYTR